MGETWKASWLLKGDSEIWNVAYVTCHVLVGYPTAHGDVGTESCREILVACLEGSVNVADKGLTESQCHVPEHYGIAWNPKRAPREPVCVRMCAQPCHMPFWLVRTEGLGGRAHARTKHVTIK